ncbi:ThiF family adenylyltransferase [Nocardia sienata]|uniref:ThiF family adenylyltransferase n=1 Tax=Nocardia sienata TaxID=248552 RepID=UPI000B0382C9|nr:ThiF family adenylyltransferase [Nocardia sienata]
MDQVNASDMRRPRIKREHVPYRTTGGQVRIGATVPGIGVEVADPGGWIWEVVQSMDATRSPAEIVDEVTRRHSSASGAEVMRAMQVLLDSGFVEDAGAPVPAELGPARRERYSRSMAFFEWIDGTPRSTPWDIQLRLGRSRVLLIGIGGVGGAAAQALVASGVGHLHCVDPDIVELSNLSRQVLYREDHIGKPKVDAAVAQLRALNSDVEITGEQRRIDSRADLAGLLRRGYDLLAFCADKPRASRRWANRACAAAELPWVTAGYHGPLATAQVHVPGQGACWECLHDQDIQGRDDRRPAEVAPESLVPQLPWHPVNAVSAVITGNLLAHLALAVLTGAPRIEPGFQYGLNLAVPGEPIYERFPPRPDCPVCGDAR